MPTSAERPGIGATSALLAASVATLAALQAVRPHLTGSPATWRGDDLAFAGTWLIAVVCAAWLSLTTLACLAAMARGEHAVAARIAAWAPPLARQVLGLALVGACAAAPSAASAEPLPPIVVHVEPSGRLSTLPSRAESLEIPVVRAAPVITTTTLARPPASHTTSTAAPISTPRTTASTTPARAPSTSPPHAAPSHAHATGTPRAARTSPAPRAAVARSLTYVVRASDNLWRIARAEVIRTSGLAHADDRHVAQYWLRVVTANRATLRSGNPSLIFPGELVAIPDIDR